MSPSADVLVYSTNRGGLWEIPCKLLPPTIARLAHPTLLFPLIPRFPAPYKPIDHVYSFNTFSDTCLILWKSSQNVCIANRTDSSFATVCVSGSQAEFSPCGHVTCLIRLSVRSWRPHIVI